MKEEDLFAWAIKAVANCEQISYNAKSTWAKEYWSKVAEEIRVKYLCC